MKQSSRFILKSIKDAKNVHLKLLIAILVYEHIFTAALRQEFVLVEIPAEIFQLTGICNYSFEHVFLGLWQWGIVLHSSLKTSLKTFLKNASCRKFDSKKNYCLRKDEFQLFIAMRVNWQNSISLPLFWLKHIFLDVSIYHDDNCGSYSFLGRKKFSVCGNSDSCPVQRTFSFGNGEICIFRYPNQS